MKLIGIDYGRRRIGLSTCDETGTLVRPLTVIDRRKRPDLLGTLGAIIEQEKPDGIVFGVPLDADDRETAMSLEIRKFAASLEKRTATPVYYIDESMTSQRAERLMLFRPKKQRRNKANVDLVAACLILETFLREKTCVD